MTATEKYYENPNYCEFCGKMIMVRYGEKPYQTKKKKFCNSSCCASLKNKVAKRVLKKKCIVCGKLITSNLTLCSDNCKIEFSLKNGKLSNMSKKELFEKYAVWQTARSQIVKHARSLFKMLNIERKCVICGYENHIEVAHIIAVKDFPDYALISEINNKNNLVALCPNHHWEFDNGILSLKDVYKNCVDL